MLLVENLSYWLLSKKVEILLLTCCVIFSLPTSPIWNSLGYDKEIFQYIGMAISKGLVPYIDIFDHKPPIIFILNYIGYLLTPSSTWGIFIIINFIEFISALFIYKITHSATSNKWMAIIISIYFIGLNNQLEILMGGNYTRQVTEFLTIFLAYILFTKNRSKTNSFLMGSILSIIFFTQQNEIISSSIFVFAYILLDTKDLHDVFKRLLWVSIGTLFVFMAMGLIIYQWGNFQEFIDQAFLFNIGSYNKKAPFFEKVSVIIQELGHLAITYKVIFLIIIYLLINCKDYQKFDSKIIITCIAFILQIISTSLSGNTFGHYFLMFIPYFCLIFIFSSKNTNRLFISSLALFLSVLFLRQIKTTYEYYSKTEKHDTKTLVAIKKIVAESKNKAGQFYSFNPKYLRINYQLGITSPSRWVYSHFAYSSYDPKGEIIDEIINGLRLNNTKYVLIINKQRKEYPDLDFYLKAHYTVRLKIDGLHLFAKVN